MGIFSSRFNLKPRFFWKSFGKSKKMETATGDSVFGVKTRSKKTDVDSVEDFQLLKNASNGNAEVHALVQDQIYQNFVETTFDPDHGPLNEDLSEDFIPHEDSVVEADEGGSSEEELDEEEGVNPPNEDEIAEINLEAAEGKAAMLKNVPPAMAEAYKKRFPHFWRMKEGLRIHTGNGYDHEEDPDFLEKKRDETIELSSDSDSESSSSEEEEEMVKEEEISELSSMVEDKRIPDDSVVEVAVEEALERRAEAVGIESESASEDSDDEIDTNEPDHLDLLNDQKDMVYENDVEYKPIEEDVNIEESSDDSYVSASGSDDDSDESTIEESEQVENMDE